MRETRAFILLILIALAIAACGGDDSGIPVLNPDFYVNPTIGSDSNVGSYVLPFKTITYAMAMAAAGNVVMAEPGTYDAANGETFPIRIASGVTLVGDELFKGAGPIQTVISGMGNFGAGEAAVVTGEGSTIAGFFITTGDVSTFDTGAVFVNATHVKVRNNTLTASYQGLFSDNGPADVRVQGNVIRYNDIGVRLSYTGMDLGGGAAESPGLNQIRCNTTTDIYMAVDEPGKPAYARNNDWDHAPPDESSTPSAGLDIYIKYIGNTIDTTGAYSSVLLCT